MIEMKGLRTSASLRVTVLVALLISVFSVISLSVQYLQVRSELARSQINDLQADLDAYSALYDQRRIPALRQAMEFRATARPTYDYVYLLLDKKGQVLAGNIPEWPAGLAPIGNGFQTDPIAEFEMTTPDNHTDAYIGVARDLPGGFPLLVAHSLSRQTQLLSDLRRRIFYVALGMSALSILGGWMVSRLVLGRINRINRLADKVAQGDLDARIPGPQTPDEFGALENHLHYMLDRIGALQKSTSDLSDAIAHELRTPLNRIRQRLNELDADDETVIALEAELQSTVAIFDALLDITAAEAATGSKPGLKPVCLSDICQNVFDLYEPLAEDRHLEMTCALPPDLWVLGDTNLIARLLANVLDNALKFTSSGDTVHLSLVPSGMYYNLTLSDSGPGLPKGLQDRAFERFTRGDQVDTVPGHGLGLALVKAIALRHGAKLRIVPDKKGFAVETRWPKLEQL